MKPQDRQLFYKIIQYCEDN